MAKTKASRHFGSMLAIDPISGTPDMEVFVTHKRIDALKKRGPAAIREFRLIVLGILQSPIQVFEGIRETEDDDTKTDGWLCYSGLPSLSCRPAAG